MPLIAAHTGYVPRKSIPGKKRDRSRNMSILSCRDKALAFGNPYESGEGRGEGGGQKTEESERRVLTISGCGATLGANYRPAANYQVEAPIYRRERVAGAFRESSWRLKIRSHPGAVITFRKKKNRAKRSLSCVQVAGGMRKRGGTEPRMVRRYGRRGKKRDTSERDEGRGEAGGGAKRKRVRKEGPPSRWTVRWGLG